MAELGDQLKDVNYKGGNMNHDSGVLNSENEELPYLSQVKVVLRKGATVIRLTLKEESSVDKRKEVRGLYVGRCYEQDFQNPPLEFRTDYDESLLVRREDIEGCEIIERYYDLPD